MSSSGGSSSDEHHEVIGGRFVYIWVWEYMLMYSKSMISIDGISGAFKEGFPVSVDRLNQMQYLRQIHSIHESKDHQSEVVLKSLRCLESFEDSLVESAEDNLQRAYWGPGFRQLCLEKKRLQQSIATLKSKLHALEEQEDSEALMHEVRQLLYKFTTSVWPLFGQMALNLVAADVVARRQQASYATSLVCREQELRMQKLDQGFRQLGDDNSALQKRIEDETNAILADSAKLQGIQRTSMVGKTIFKHTQSQVTSIQNFPYNSMFGLSTQSPQLAWKPPNPGKRIRSTDSEDEDTKPLQDVRYPSPKGVGLQSNTQAPTTGNSGVKRGGRGRFSKEEDEIILAEVDKHGTHWKRILTKYPHLFQGRTDVQLKDRHRNILKHR